MEEEKKYKEIELRSEEVQEVMNHISPWVVRWGITVLFIILLALLAGCWIFKYPDVLQAEVTLTTEEPPAFILALESNITSYTDTGLASIYFGTDPKNREKAMRLVHKELARLRDVKLSATQLAAAKKQVIGQLGVSGDNREGLFLGLGKSYLHYNRYDTLPEVFAQIEKITAGQILEVANEVLAPERLFCLIYE